MEQLQLLNNELERLRTPVFENIPKAFQMALVLVNQHGCRELSWADGFSPVHWAASMNRKDIIDLYADDEPEIMFADGYDKAIAGVVWDGERTRVVYTTEKILSILMEDGMPYDEASEFFDFNVAGAYMGVYTPLYLET